MWQDQHAFEIKKTLGVTPDQLQSKMDFDARNKVMESVKVHLKYISKDRDSIIRNKKQLEKPDLKEEDKIKLINENFILEKRKVLECKQTEEYLDRHINEKYGSSNVKVHTKYNINTFEEVKGWFMDPPQGMFAGLQLTGDNYPPDFMEREINEYL